MNVASYVRAQMPEGGLFAGQSWRIAPRSFPLEPRIAKEIESLGRVLLQFNKAVNLLYRHSVAGKQPEWVARWLDLGKPEWLVEMQRSHEFKNDWPRVIRPDLLLTDEGLAITELDSVPGGIGLTGWLGRVYEDAIGLAEDGARGATPPAHVLGGRDGVAMGFASMFGKARRVHLVVSEESATYRPEMEWLCREMNLIEKGERFAARDSSFAEFAEGDAVYRFFELFDAANVPSARRIFELAAQGAITVTPPPKPIFEEKMLFALLWNRNLREFWRRELGEGFFKRMLAMTPYTWIVDPSPLPPHGAIPELNLTDWAQLKAMSQKERNLILKVSGFSEKAWGARGVYLGSDLPTDEWARAVEEALREFPRGPYVLQRYHKPRVVDFEYFDFAKNEVVKEPGRARICPYYFVSGEGDAARANLGGILATVCPADKKIIHGMTDATLAPCGVGDGDAGAD